MTFGKILTQSSFFSTVGLQKNKKIDWVPQSSNRKCKATGEKSTAKIRTNYKDLFLHNSIHPSPPLHAKDS